MCYCTSYKAPCLLSTHRNTHSEHSQDFFVLLPAHSKAKGLVCHLQCVADGAGGVSVEAADVLMGDFKPLPVGIIDLRREREREERRETQPHRQCECGLISHGHVRTLLCTSLFLSAFVLYSICVKDALIKNCF